MNRWNLLNNLPEEPLVHSVKGLEKSHHASSLADWPASYLPNGHEAVLVRMELFIPYIEIDLFIIDHHNGAWHLANQMVQAI